MKRTSVCRTGPTCRLHGNTHQAAFMQDLEEHAQKNNLYEVRGLQNKQQDQFKCLYEASQRLWDTGAPEIRNAVSRYQRNSYILVNSYLRKQEEGLRSGLDEYHSRPSSAFMFSKAQKETEEQVKNIDIAFKEYSIPLNSQPLYRSVTLHDNPRDGETPSEYAQRVHPIGSTVTDEAYISTSGDPDFMLMQARNNRDITHPFIVYEIQANTGMPVFPKNLITGEEDRPHTLNRHSQMQNYEREVMLNRGSQFTVVSVQEMEFAHGYSRLQVNELKHRWDVPAARTFTVVKLVQQ